MSYADNPYRSSNWDVAANADEQARIDFIRKTYLHLGAAVAAFAAIEAVLLNLPGVEQFAVNMMGYWFVVLGAFMLVSWVANSWALNATSLGKQYAGLALYVVAEAVVFLPLLVMAEMYKPKAIPEAATATLAIFGGLTAVVFLTKKDFSFLRTGLTIAGFAALGLILCSMLFGFNLGMVFVVAMIALSAGYILYYTSNVLHHYGTGQYVAAALALFASVALLFWYLLQLFSSRD